MKIAEWALSRCDLRLGVACELAMRDVRDHERTLENARRYLLTPRARRQVVRCDEAPRSERRTSKNPCRATLAMGSGAATFASPVGNVRREPDFLFTKTGHCRHKADKNIQNSSRTQMCNLARSLTHSGRGTRTWMKPNSASRSSGARSQVLPSSSPSARKRASW
jgi:hypothetical protein